MKILCEFIYFTSITTFIYVLSVRCLQTHYFRVTCTLDEFSELFERRRLWCFLKRDSTTRELCAIADYSSIDRT